MQPPLHADKNRTCPAPLWYTCLTSKPTNSPSTLVPFTRLELSNQRNPQNSLVHVSVYNFPTNELSDLSCIRIYLSHTQPLRALSHDLLHFSCHGSSSKLPWITHTYQYHLILENVEIAPTSATIPGQWRSRPACFPGVNQNMLVAARFARTFGKHGKTCESIVKVHCTIITSWRCVYRSKLGIFKKSRGIAPMKKNLVHPLWCEPCWQSTSHWHRIFHSAWAFGGFRTGSWAGNGERRTQSMLVTAAIQWIWTESCPNVPTYAAGELPLLRWKPWSRWRKWMRIAMEALSTISTMEYGASSSETEQR